VTLTPGTRLGTYQIVGLLGAGGMGEVYRAQDRRLGRDIAVKVLPADLASSPERLARFEREARTVGGLNHPNIVTLYSVEDADGIRFLTMELVEGQTFSNLIAPGGLPLPKLLDLAVPLADALAAAHERGVIHRDLKPGNVMVTREGRVKVLDFGLAKMMSLDGAAMEVSGAPTVDGPLSVDGQVAGTVPYMAPEQLRGVAVDARSDLFALGIILYELATGRRPFIGTSHAEVTSAILRDAPEELNRIRPDFPDDLARIVSRCLEKDPRARIQSALEVSNELRRLRNVLERGVSPKPPSVDLASIAVLPFANRSASADDEYFSDGLADELLHVLAKIKGLRVTARTSAFTFKGKQATVAEIGRALNVATLLEGSVRKAGNRIRVSVQLVNVGDSSHLWSETYDRTLEDIFAVQDDIAQSVVKELRATLLGGEADSEASGEAKADVARATKGRGVDPEARRIVLLARYLLDRMTREDTGKAIEYLREALAMDPSYALAWAELSHAYGMQADMAWAPVAEGYARARDAAERARSLEPELPEGHIEIAWIQAAHDWDFRGANGSFSRALELAPDNVEALRGAASLARMLGDLERSIPLFQRALAQDPLSAGGHSALGFALQAADRDVEAEAALRKALELTPGRIKTNAVLAVVLCDLGRGEDALAQLAQEPHEGFRMWARAIVHHRLGHRADSDAALAEMIEKHSSECPFQIAEVYGSRGQVDEAFEWLERAYVEKDGGITAVKATRCLRSLHTDPRWHPFLMKMKLEA